MKMGGMKGPRSFETAGEIAEGIHHALSYSREAYDYLTEHVRDRAPSKAGRNFDDLDIGAWVVTVVSEDSAAAKRAARILVAFYISSMPPEQLARHGIDAAELQPVVDALGAGDIPKAVELFKPEYTEKLSLAGTPEEVRREDPDRHPAGGRQPHDPRARGRRARQDVLGRGGRRTCRTSSGQLRLVAERVMPAFEPALRSTAPAPRRWRWSWRCDRKIATTLYQLVFAPVGTGT